ncbi:MAG: ribosomal RNA small subunit methyltransferase I [Gemmatimonadales bacterium]|nr:MAG: ribosomal RNA small subunit methyltransferase I [Gemmatimonadales bacterium]
MSAGTLYVVATPLGNLGDLSERAAAVLRQVDLVAAEDTRRSRILLEHVSARPRLVSLHAHSPAGRAEELVRLLRAGQSIALLSDAGTPLVSDPGLQLVRRARELEIPVVAVPGPSAVTAALSIAGFPADRYTFLGFIPRSGREREQLLEAIVSSPWTVVVFEAANRVVRLLEDLCARAGAERSAAVARELTKIHEECRVGTLRELAVYYGNNPPRGEVTVVIEGSARQPESKKRQALDKDEILGKAKTLLAQGLSRRDVASKLSEELGISRNRAYRLVTEL